MAPRPKVEPTREQLQALIDEGLSLSVIARRLGYSPTSLMSVRRAMEVAGVDYEAKTGAYRWHGPIRNGAVKGTNGIADQIAAEKAKLVIARDKKAVSALLRQASMVEMVVDCLREAIDPIADFRMPADIRGEEKGGDEEAAVLLISDAQIGKVTPSYDSATFAERMELLTDKTIKIANIHRSDHPVNNLHCFWLGDMPDGQLIYPTQAYHTDANAVNQIFRHGMPVCVDSMARFASNFRTVTNKCVRGNHGRTGKFAEETSNWDLVFYEAMKLATRQVPNVSWDITEDWKLLTEVMGWKFLLNHGHTIRMQLNIPHYGITTRGMRWQGSVGRYDYLCLGHFHTSSMMDWNEWELFLNGTFVSDDDFTEENLGLVSSTRQILFFVHPEQGVTARYKLQLAPRKQL
jgi:predicted phosphodiesterase